MSIGNAPALDGGATDPATASLPTDHAGTDEPVGAQVAEGYAKVPLSFEINRGQVESVVDFHSRGPGYQFFLTGGNAVMQLSSDDDDSAALANVLRINLVGAASDPRVTGLELLPTRSNYLQGADPSQWRIGIEHYARVQYEQVYPGVNLVYYGTNQRQLEYDFVVAPGVDPQVIRLQFDGADALAIDDRGQLVAQLGETEVTQHAPIIYQQVGSERRVIEGSYVLVDHQVAFEVGAYDPNQPLIIDPILSYSTYLGGDGYDECFDVAVDQDGNAYVVGTTESTDFPTGVPYQPAIGGDRDAFISKLDPNGATLIYSTYFGGSLRDTAVSVAVDATGQVFVSGRTESTDFPTANPFQAENAGGDDLFIAKLNATGSDLVYSTYLGGSQGEGGGAMAVDSDGRTTVVGASDSADFPLLNPIDATNSGGPDAFVARLNAAGSALEFSTFLGGTGVDFGSGVVVDSDGNTYVTGRTEASDFPLLNARDSELGGVSDAFVSKLSPDGTALVYSTYLGGSDMEDGLAVAVDATGNATVTGLTFSADFPTVNAYASMSGIADAFVAKLDAAGADLVYSTCLGGQYFDAAQDIVVDDAGAAYVVGITDSPDFPTVAPIQNDPDPGVHGFVTKVNFEGNALSFSTYLGGNLFGYDFAYAIAVDDHGNAFVVGSTDSIDFPVTPGVLQSSQTEAETPSGFVTKIGVTAEYGSIQGIVYSDRDGNGVQDDGEWGVQDWTVFLDADDNGVLDDGETSVQTDVLGSYLLDHVAPGTYVVRHIALPLWTPVSPVPGEGHTVLVASGTATSGHDFGNLPPASILGQVRDNTTQNGLSDWTVFLDANDNGVLDVGEQNVQTNSLGYYAVYDVAPGTHVIRQIPLPQWTPVSPPAGEGHIVTVQNGEVSAGHDFTNLPPATIQGRVFHDANGNGVSDFCDVGITVMVFADANDNGNWDDGEYRSDSDATGHYRLSVAPGTYKLRVIDTWDYELVDPALGYYEISIAAGEVSEDHDFRHLTSWSMSGKKFHDIDGDGVKDVGEPGLEGWTVYLDNNGNRNLDSCEPRAVTNSQGVYTITNIIPSYDLYVVREVQQTGWLQTSPGFALDEFWDFTGAADRYALDSVFADLNGDQTMDVASANDTNYEPIDDATSLLTVQRGNSDGTLSTVFDYSEVITVLDSDGDPWELWLSGHDIAQGDLDGDGAPDLVVLTHYDPNLYVLPPAAPLTTDVMLFRNQSDGTFARWDSYAAGLMPQSVAVADLDGDLDLDLAITNRGDNTVSVLFNDGEGTFMGLVHYDTGDEPWHIIAADLDMDGDRDLAVANRGSNDVSIFRNDGNGTLQAGNVIAVGSGPVRLVAADFNYDSDLDLAVANHDSADITLLENSGNATFASQETIDVGNQPVSLAAADFDRDNDIDLAVATYFEDRWDSYAQFLINDGLGSLTFMPESWDTWYYVETISAVDWDHDGYQDLAVGGLGFQSAINRTGEHQASVFDTGIDFGNQQRVAVSIPDAVAERETTISLPINISDATGVQSAEITLVYDTQQLDLANVDVQLGELTAGWGLTANVNDVAGFLSFGLYGTTPLSSGSGSVAVIDLHIPATAVRGLALLDLVRVSLNEDTVPAMTEDGTVEIISNAPEVIDFQVAPSGFQATFNRDLELSVLNLYDGMDASVDTADLVLRGERVGKVSGSVVFRPDDRTLRFVKTGSPLEPDTYTATLLSRADGFVGANGKLLDGDLTGFQGGDFVHTFVVEPATRSVSLPDFARGPDQVVNVPSMSAGLPLRISDSEGVNSISLDILYDPALLELTAAELADPLSGSWQLTTDFSVPGQLSIDAFGPTILSAVPRDLILLSANIPATAPLGSAQSIRLDSVLVNGGAIAVVGDEAFHKVAYFGDVTGNRAFSGLDAANVARVAVGLDSGFDEFELADPVILGDVTGNGSISNLDASYLARKSVGLPQPEIPDLPGTLPPLILGGPDPVVRIPRGTVSMPGAEVTLPIDLEGGMGLMAADLVIAYDTTLLDLSVSDIQRGAATNTWSLVANVDDDIGLITLTTFSPNPLTVDDGELLRITCHNAPGMTGTSALDLEGYLNEGRLELTPVDGDITFWTAIEINGQKYEDLNGDGQKQAGENGLAGWTIFLDDNRNGSWDSGETKTVTGSDGRFAFTDLGPGTYVIREIMQPAWFTTTAEPADVNAVSGVNVSDVEFGNYQASSITGRVFQDRTANGTVENGDDGIVDWTVFLDANSNGKLDAEETATSTDADGDFLFANMAPGPHRVRVTQELDWLQTTPDPPSLVPLSGEVVTSIDFGQYDTQSHPWQNFRNPLDVDNDGGVYPLDALFIINRLNDIGSGPLPVPPDVFPVPLIHYYDTTGSESCEPLDALLVINYLNDPNAGGEGEVARRLVERPLSSTLVPSVTYALPYEPASEPDRLSPSPRRGHQSDIPSPDLGILIGTVLSNSSDPWLPIGEFDDVIKPTLTGGSLEEALDLLLQKDLEWRPFRASDVWPML